MSAAAIALSVLEKAAEIAERHGPEIVNAWKLIEQSLRAEHPALVTTPLPALDEVETAREAALRRSGPGRP